MTVANPYDRVSDEKNWQRWNAGLEDGERGEPRRGKSTAYNAGYDAGIARFRMSLPWGSYKGPGSPAWHRKR